MSNQRLRAVLTYEDESNDVFDWQLYVPDELAELVSRSGLKLKLPCAGPPVQQRSDSGDLLQGTLGILILKALLPGTAHGYAIARWVEDTTEDVLRIEEGSLYPALRRLEDRRWVSSEWGLSENNRRARFYTITAAGRKHLRDEAAVWLRYSQAVTRVLRTAPAVA
ncbi:MAG: PadR family transcriptional regulator [Gemmatimonadetes bacterium]|nr:PadR family transcriptional regulator [Gemmatimonadota bacterium]